MRQDLGRGRAAIRGAAALAIVALAQLGLAGPAQDAALAAFRRAHGAAWTVGVDPASGRARRLTGGSTPLGLPATHASDADLLAATSSFLADAAPSLGLDVASLKPSALAVVTVSDGTLVAVHLDVAPHGVPIDNERVTVALSHGNVVDVDVATGPAFDADPTPHVTPAAAHAAALAAASLDAANVLATPAPELRWRREPQGVRLAWKVTLIRATPPSRHVAFVDAVTGTILALTEETVSQCAPPPPGGRPGSVLAGVRPRRADEAERPELLAGATVGATTSDSAGQFTPQPIPFSATLAGPVASVECSSCSNPVAPMAVANVTGDADFSQGGADETGNGFATPADRAGFFFVERVHRMATRWLSVPWLSRVVTVRTNLPDECNAYWNGVALNFFRSSPRCANTGEIRDVVSHEWGHGLDENDGIAPPGVTVDAATGEAVADTVAILRSRDSCIGESFFLSPGDFPSTTCSGVRDVDELAPGNRHGLQSVATASSNCSPSPFYRGVMGREGHCEGEIFGQAFWHLVQTLKTGTSYGDGRVLAPALGDEAAWQVAEALFYRSRPFVASYAPSTMQSIGMSAYDAFLAADDEGDGVANGTPHAWAIQDAFEHHGIAEAGAPPPPAPPCAAVAPAVTATTLPDPTLGRAVVHVDWTDSGAAAYRVLRDDADAGGLAPLAPAFGPGAGSFDDRGVLAGRAPRYVVVAESANGCVAPSTPVAAAASPMLEVAAVRIDDSVTGDGDGRLAAGETADVFVDLENWGGVPFTNAMASLEPVDPDLAIVSGGPLDYGTIPPTSTGLAPAAFRVQASLTAPSVVTLGVVAQGVEGCLRASWLLPIARPDLDLESTVIDDAAGDADGAWDPGELVNLDITLRDVGALDAQSVTGVLSFRSGPPTGVTMPGTSASWGTIAVAASVVSGPGFSLNATAAVPRGTVVPLDLAVSIAGTAYRTYPIDLVVGGIAAGLLKWEVHTETWSPDRTGEIVNQPLVAQTNDDDGDGRVTSCDIPDIIVEEWNTGSADDAITVLSGDDGRVLRTFPVNPCRGGWTIFQTLAAADLNGDGIPEILADGSGTPCAFELDGSLLWRASRQAWWPEFTPGFCAAAPQVWDLDGDGNPEVIVGRAVLDGLTGAILYTDMSRRDTGRSLVGDIDLDGKIDVISYRGDVRDATGTIRPGVFPGFWQMGGLVNLDSDPEAEVVYTAVADQPTPSVVARDHDGTLRWEWVATPGHDMRPPPCWGDFDGDGLAETAVPAGSEMIMFDDDGTIRWQVPTDDVSGASGCSVFDFDLDGKPEIVYRDEQHLKVFRGETGQLLWQVPCLSFTQYEFPIIADVDNDGHADIVTYALTPPDRSALQVYSNPAWPPARGIWNQENYSVTHVTDDGHAVTAPPMRWLAGNDFRGQSNGCSCAGAELQAFVDLPCGTTNACFRTTVTGGAAPFVLTWDFGDGSPLRTGDTPCHDYAPGRYVARVTLADMFACPAETAVIVDVPERLAVSVTGTPACGVTSCLTATVTGGVAPVDIAWDFDVSGGTATTAVACFDFPGPGYAWHVAVRDAAGCIAEASGSGTLGTPPADVGGVLYVNNHSDPYGANIDATQDWSGDLGLPRPGTNTYRVLRGTVPTALTVIPGTAGLPTPTYRDSTPAATSLPFVHFYLVFAEDPCGGVSAD